MTSVHSIAVNSWFYFPEHRQLCRVIETQTLWGETFCRVWLPGKDTVVRLPAASLRPVHEASFDNVDKIVYLATAARVTDALSHDVLLAPIESSVIPLPHQIRALSQAISQNRVRYLLADEVGLGKTIEAGLIMRELKLRGLVNRTLIVVPRGLVTQWVAELAFYFNERFIPIMSEDYKSLKRISGTYTYEVQRVATKTGHNIPQPQITATPIGSNPFRMFNQVLVSMDSVKPVDRMKSAERGYKFSFSSQDRFEDLISANWDLIIVDEAHRLGGSTESVARYKLGLGLSEAAPYLLLLSATPHQGKTDSFRRLMSLIDQQAFPDCESITQEKVRPYVIRTEKRYAIDTDGKPLFKPRVTKLFPVKWEPDPNHVEQRRLYEAVTEYVREGYNQAKAQKNNYIGFLMILLQRLVVSSVRAIRMTLERRLDVLNSELFLAELPADPESFYDLDGEEQLELLLKAKIRGIREEKAKVEALLKVATECEGLGPDVKAEALLEWIYRLQAKESDPDLKILVFTEFIPTQEMLYEFLSDRGFKVVCINGSMGMEERRKVQDEFARDARILISTDAGGEGINLQFCHVVINYDIPWNPMKLEQRIGRVDRIGQTKIVKAINFVHEDSVEHRVIEVLEEKLAVIYKELGIDKTGDVLDSAQANYIFDSLYVEAILNPEKVEEKLNEVLNNVREQAMESRGSLEVIGSNKDFDTNEARKFLTHPLPYWVERMTVAYLKAYGGEAKKENGTWNLRLPDGRQLKNVVFTAKEYNNQPWAKYITLENPIIRGIAQHIPRFVPGQPIPVISITGLPPEIVGYWGVWKILLSASGWRRARVMPLFMSDNGKTFIPTARHIWDKLLSTTPFILGHMNTTESAQILEKFSDVAEDHGKVIFDELVSSHKEHLVKERGKILYAFSSQRKAIERIGLPEVRNYRLKRLVAEKRRYLEEIDQKSRIVPELVPIIIVRVEHKDAE